MSDEYVQSMHDDFGKVVEAFKRDLSAIRTGRASPALIEHLPVEVASYGTTMPLNQLGNVTAPDARLLVVNPWDKGTLKDIKNAIANAGLGLNPSDDGQILRVPIPALTTERRKEMVKLIGTKTEDARVKARGVRRDYNELFKSLEADKDITQDDLKRYLEVVQKSTDDYVRKLDDMAGAKEKEVLEL